MRRTWLAGCWSTTPCTDCPSRACCATPGWWRSPPKNPRPCRPARSRRNECWFVCRDVVVLLSRFGNCAAVWAAFVCLCVLWITSLCQTLMACLMSYWSLVCNYVIMTFIGDCHHYLNITIKIIKDKVLRLSNVFCLNIRWMIVWIFTVVFEATNGLHWVPFCMSSVSLNGALEGARVSPICWDL